MVDEPKQAERLFADWLSRRDAGKSVPIAWFAAAHPSFANELLHLHRVWKRLDEFGTHPTPLVNEDDVVANRLRSRLAASVPTSRASVETSTEDVVEVTVIDSRSNTRDAGVRIAEENRSDLATPASPPTIARTIELPPATTPPLTTSLSTAPTTAPRFEAPARIDPPSRDLELIFEMSHSGAEGWNLTRAVSTILRVCEAMEGSHEKGVIHRDLKPTNVKIGRHGEVYVMDWGFARVLGAQETRDIRPDPARSIDAANGDASVVAALEAPLLTADGDVIGLPCYMPPEQAAGDIESVGPWSDVYSVGAMLYHLLSGLPPYVERDEIRNGKAVLKRVLAGPPESIQTRARHAPAELAAICERAMSRVPKRRYARMHDLAEDLRAYLERRVVKAYRVGTLHETKTWVRRHRDLAAAIAGAFIVLAGFAWQRHIDAKNAERASHEAWANARDARATVELEKQHAEQRVRVFRLADREELRDLRIRGRALLEDASEVYRSARGYHALVESLANWIDDATALSHRLPEHEATLAELESRGVVDPKSSAIEFDSIEDSWWRDELHALVTEFRELEALEGEAISIPTMRARIDAYEAQYARSVGKHQEAWAECIASIADDAECPLYGGLRIVPQLGLRPIGRDRESGLWEFSFVDAGASVPERRDDGTLSLADDHGVVFVLLPGGTFWMGAQSEDPSGPNYDPWAIGDVVSVHRLSIAPYFLSKFELTRRQWSRLSNETRSANDELAGREPVSAVSWFDAVAVLGRHGLDLPTEAQWEYACRAGTSTPWATGADSASLAGFANVRIPRLETMLITEKAPIGSFRPNAFGLHDQHGNLFEWCRDGYTGAADYSVTPDESSGEHVVSSATLRAFRGGCYRDEANLARSAFRLGKDPNSRVPTIGIRARRDLMPE